MIWYASTPTLTPQALGLITTFFSEDDPRPAVEQLRENYPYGHPRPSTDMRLRNWKETGGAVMTFPGDPPFYELARASLRDETLIFFQHEYLAIVQADGSYVTIHVD